MHQRKNESGFSMVELAIALMVIGLLIGGVLKGREMIVNARATKTATQLAAVDGAVTQFFATYNALPGDIIVVAGVVPQCDATPCSNSGDGDNRLWGDSERSNFWRHLGRAGLLSDVNLLSASTNPMDIGPETAIGGRLYAIYNDQATWGGNATAWQGNSLGFTQRYGKNILLSLIDLKIDDGNPYTGEVRVEDPIAGSRNCVLASGAYSSATARAATCNFFMRLKVR